jgi:hypothetical protein
VFVHAGVPFTFFGERGTGGAAGLQNCAVNARVGRCLAGHDGAGGCADVRAVQIRADATGEVGDHVLGQARVCAGCARLGALKARGEAVGQLCLVRGFGGLGVDDKPVGCDGPDRGVF